MTGRPSLSWYRTYGLMRDKAFTIMIRPSFAALGIRSVVQPPFRVYGEHRIAIGSEVFIGAHSWLQVIETDATGPPIIEIGDGTNISGHCTVSAVERVTVGRSVLMARNVYVSDHSHALGDPGRPIVAQGVAGVRPVEIADGAWLGQNTVVTPGVRIGRGAVVGANSVVTHDVPDRALAVGAPARVIRHLP